MQNDLITGSLGTKEAETIVSNVTDKIKAYAELDTYEDVVILCTLDTHDKDYLDTLEGKNLPIPHCIKNTEGWNINTKIYDVLVEADNNTGIHFHIIQKNTFGSVKLAETIRNYNKNKGVDTVELVGLCTDICVISNALLIKAFCPEIHIAVDSSCCAGVTPEAHTAALKTMESCQIQITR